MEKTHTLQMRCSPEWLETLDDWRRKSTGNIPTRADAIRHLVGTGLQAQAKDRPAETAASQAPKVYDQLGEILLREYRSQKAAGYALDRSPEEMVAADMEAWAQAVDRFITNDLGFTKLEGELEAFIRTLAPEPPPPAARTRKRRKE